jgi:hypothetical protein
MNQVIYFIHYIFLQLHDHCKTQRMSGLQHLVNQCIHSIRFTLDCPIQDLIRLLLPPKLV